MKDEPETMQGDVDDEKSSAGILAALKKAEAAFRDWQATCEVIDQIYSRDGYGPAGRVLGIDGFSWQDATMDLFWSSFEVLKPAVYARPPQPVVSPMFRDSKRLSNVTAELLERCAASVFKRTDMNEVMLGLRDDLIFTGRGAPWVRHEGGAEICIEHKDRLDFLHEPARKWSEVGWVAGAAWLTKKDMRERFKPTSDDAYLDASYEVHKDDDGQTLEKRATARKCKVWEVWHKADGKVYWVTEGVGVLLDSDKPHLKLSGFFPCPRPAYATLRRRSLIPVPDYERYSIHFDKISELTSRIYLLLDSVKMKGLIPAGGDVGDAIEQLIRSDDDKMLIPVPGAAMIAGGATGFVVWLPLTEVAEAIQGLIAARTQMVSDFYELSGISDIMRGATEADETLGAQQLKTQYGSVRVREKSAELQRVAADTVAIVAEIIAEKVSPDDLLDLSQMEVPKRKDLEERVREIEDAAKAELKKLETQAKEMAEQAQGQVDPAQAQQMLQQAQQGILGKYAPMLAEVEEQVALEDVVELLRDERTRGFTFEIESSSTILTDELQEKTARGEFLDKFMNASQGLMAMAAMGEQGAKLAGEILKFALAPYRVGRQLDGAIEEFIEAAPQMAQAAKGEEGDAGLAEANKMLAEAEMTKAKAAMAGVEAKAALDKAEMQRRMQEMQQKAGEAEFKAQAEAEKLRQMMAAEQAKASQIEAQVNKLTAETAAILHSIGLDERKQELAEYTAATNEQARQTDQAIQAQSTEADLAFRAKGEERADRQQDFTEQSGERQQTFAEKQAAMEARNGDG